MNPNRNDERDARRFFTGLLLGLGLSLAAWASLAYFLL